MIQQIRSVFSAGCETGVTHHKPRYTLVVMQRRCGRFSFLTLFWQNDEGGSQGLQDDGDDALSTH